MKDFSKELEATKKKYDKRILKAIDSLSEEYDIEAIELKQMYQGKFKELVRFWNALDIRKKELELKEKTLMTPVHEKLDKLLEKLENK